MSNFIQKIKHIFQDSALRKQVLFVLGILAAFRVLSVIPIPGVDQTALSQFLDSNQFFGLLNIFSGGGLSTLSIVMLGVGPYITASIIMQLLTMMSPKLKSMYQEEGAIGRKKFSQYSRLLSVPLAFAQAFGFIVLLQRQGIVASLDSFSLLTNVLVIVAGSVFLMWLGEVMTEFGIGNGLSMIIFAGIVAVVPQVASQIFYAFQIEDLFTYIALGALALLMVLLVVYITEAERPIPVTYAKQIRGGQTHGGTSTYLPLRLNQAGVIPIIFALSLLLLPQMVLNFLTYLHYPAIDKLALIVTDLMANPWFYAGAYFVLVFFFTFFYTAVTFDPKSISENLQKGGAFIPGVRPGESTEAYLGKVVTRITLVGALFLALVAVLPPVLKAITGISYLTVGGTGLLIVVSVVLDIVKKVDAQLSMREY
ncbi:MAG: preprotein translocase subunit SecY [Candidatus Pacebacteria bacterium]|nr:preprotein translocase subunit SecY [Candidatus Paceibacterota bacterium]